MKHRNRESGQAILEAALILPLFIFVGLGMADIQWAISDAGELGYIVQEAARCEAIGSLACAAPANPRTYATTLAQQLHLNLSNFTVPNYGCNPGAGTCTVTATYAYHAIGPWFPSMVMTRVGTAALPAPAGGGQ